LPSIKTFQVTDELGRESRKKYLKLQFSCLLGAYYRVFIICVLLSWNLFIRWMSNLCFFYGVTFLVNRFLLKMSLSVGLLCNVDFAFAGHLSNFSLCQEWISNWCYSLEKVHDLKWYPCFSFDRIKKVVVSKIASKRNQIGKRFSQLVKTNFSCIPPQW
jgi:hypothetical protein